MNRRNQDYSALHGGRVVVCLESSERVSERLRRFLAGLECQSDYILAHSPSDPSQLVSLCRRLAPVLIAVEDDQFSALPLAAIRDLIARGDVRILVFSMKVNSTAFESLLRKGCSGILPADVGDTTMRRAFEAVFSGELWAPRKVLSAIARETLSRDRSKDLTRREADIHRLICLGLTNQQIADQLFISRETVRWHVRSLYSKLGVPSQRRSMLEMNQAVEMSSAAVISAIPAAAALR